ncbi:MAG: glycosyltransferase family 9 protein [Verrucomicrobiae bacterium]|nr:glycosyltransferase family 9 protein [Verrucomicrobiae bacterium]
MALFRQGRRAFGRMVVRLARGFRDGIFGRVTPPAPDCLPSRILIIRPFYMGDILLSLPILQAIKRRNPAASTAWLLREEWADLLRGHCLVDEVIAYSEARLHSATGILEWWRVARELRRRRFGLVLNLAWDRSSLLWAWFCGAGIRTGIEEYGRPRLLSLLQNINVLAPERSSDMRHMADFYHDALAPFGFGARDEMPRVWSRPEEETAVKKWLSARGLEGKPYFLVHPGGRLRGKRWAPERFAELLRRLKGWGGNEIVLVYGPGEASWVENELKDCSAAFWPVPTLGELMALVSGAVLFVGNDSGPMHLAAACGRPVVAIFGNDPTRWHPLGGRQTVVGGAKGLDAVSVDEVLAAVRFRLEEKPENGR